MQNNNVKNILLITAPFYFGLFIALFMLFKCEKSGVSTKITKHVDSSIVYLKDTSKRTYSSTNIYPVTTITFTPLGNIDTAAVIAAYYKKHYYKQVLGDSLISITTEDTVHCNSIDYSKITWQFKKPYQVIKTFTVTEIKPVFKGNGLYVGVYAEANRQLFGIGPQANLIFKNNNIGLGFNIFNRSALIQYSRKIGK